MGRISKISLLSLEWRGGLLALNISIFFKNNVMKKTKKTLNKKTFERLQLHSAKATHTWVLGIRNSCETNIYLRSLLKKYVVCKSRVEIGHMFMEISLNLADFTDFF